VPEQYDAVIECAAFVNWRRAEAGDEPVLALLFHVLRCLAADGREGRPAGCISRSPLNGSIVRHQGGIVTVKRMDNVGIVVEDIDAAIEFFTELGLILEGRMPIEGEWAGRVTGVRGQRVEVAMMRTPDGYSRLELSRFDAPAIASDHRTAPVNSLGYLRVMFAVEDIDDTLARLSKLGATVVDEVVTYEDLYRLCYIRGPEGILIGLAQQLGQQTARENPMESQR
jgi:catechol 2,3-dioxygenase-like lactoylglutathione lyase family enzyme